MNTHTNVLKLSIHMHKASSECQLKGSNYSCSCESAHICKHVMTYWRHTGGQGHHHSHTEQREKERERGREREKERERFMEGMRKRKTD